MPSSATQPDLISTEPSSEVDDRLQKRIEEIYSRGSTVGDFFKFIQDKVQASEEQEECTTLPHGALLFHRR